MHPDSFIAVAAAMANPRTVGGTSGVAMERWSIGIALTYAMMMGFVWLTGFDTGLVFWRRADFEALGGYDERRMAAEDIDFLVRLRRLGRTRGQRPPASSTSTATGTRTQMPAQGWRLLRDRSALNDFARRYWYEGR